MNDEETREVESLRERVRRLEEALAMAGVLPWDWNISQDTVASIMSAESLQTVSTNAELPKDLDGFLTIIHPDDRAAVREAVRATLEHDVQYVSRYRLVANPDLGWMEARGVLQRDADRRPVRLVGIVQPIGERKALEDKLLHSQKLEALGLLAGGVAHDFNNLLTSVLLSTELISSVLPADQREQPILRDSLSEIRHAGQRGAELTRQMLAFTRRQLIARVPVDVMKVVEEVVQLSRRLVPESIKLTLHTEPGAHFVLGEHSQLTQVLLNLIVNARDAMPDGGSLDITVREETLEPARAAELGARPGRHARLQVRDTGIGIDRETLTRIFEPFFTTKGVGHGTGLGLSTAHGIVVQLGGAIAVESEPGKGATFDVYLPTTDARPDGAAQRRPAQEPVSAGQSVLVVEDDEAVRAAVCAVLRRAGYRVFDAASPGLALAPDGPGKAEVQHLVTDVVLPDMNGVELAAALRSRSPGLKVLFMSGHISDEKLRTSLAASNARVLLKPFTPDALLDALGDRP